MKSSRLKSFSTIFVILLLVGVGYYYRSEIWARWRELLNRFQPCQSPITYSIVDLDSRFGLTKTELLADIKRAEKIWEVPINKTLFQYSATGDLKINLIYDYRQKATDALKKIGLVIGDDRVSYDALKVKRDSLLVRTITRRHKLSPWLMLTTRPRRLTKKRLMIGTRAAARQKPSSKFYNNNELI